MVFHFWFTIGGFLKFTAWSIWLAGIYQANAAATALAFIAIVMLDFITRPRKELPGK